MPIYAYRCTRCGHELDALQKLSEPALTDCPACREPALVKKLTAAGFQLKGSGWYQTDFRQTPKPAATDAKADAKPASTDAPSTSTESTTTKAEPPSPPPAAGCGSGCSCH